MMISMELARFNGPAPSAQEMMEQYKKYEQALREAQQAAEQVVKVLRTSTLNSVKTANIPIAQHDDHPRIRHRRHLYQVHITAAGSNGRSRRHH
ncbi:hypothetical protein HYZ99_00675 [Candidatus Peregrinibacteria bacterium]|nr:hypothetical protein [Candidatus Peregrinibacteria bacterium]